MVGGDQYRPVLVRSPPDADPETADPLAGAEPELGDRPLSDGADGAGQRIGADEYPGDGGETGGPQDGAEVDVLVAA